MTATKIETLRRLLDDAALPHTAVWPAVVSALEQRLETALPTELRTLIDELGDVPSLQSDGATLLDGVADELSRLPSGPFPYSNDEAAALMRPDEPMFVGELGPPGAVAIARDDSTVTYLVVRGEQAGCIWIGSAYGLCPAFDMADDAPQPTGLLAWYERALRQWMEARATAALQSDANEGVIVEQDLEAHLLSGSETAQPELLGDVAALEAEIDLAPEGSTIIVREGTYRLSKPLELRRAVTLRAESNTVTLVAPPGEPCLRVQAADAALAELVLCGEDAGLGVEIAPGASLRAMNCTLRYLRVGITSRGTAQLRALTIASCEVGVEAHERAKVTLIHCHFDACTSSAIRVESGFVKAVTNLIEGSAANGVEIFAGRLVLERNQILRTTSRAVLARGGRAILRSNVIARAEVGILIQSAVRASNNLIVDTAVGIQAEGALRQERCVIRGNALLDNHYDGMMLLAGTFDLSLNQCGANRQTGISILEEGTRVVATLRDNAFYFHGKDGLHVSLAAPCAPMTIAYCTTFENANAGLRIGNGTLSLLLRNQASHDGLLGITTQESSDVVLLECETYGAGVFGVAAWERSGVTLTRSRDVGAGFAALGAFGSRSEVRDAQVEPPSAIKRASLCTDTSSMSAPGEKLLTRQELTALFPDSMGFVRSRARVHGDPPVRCAESSVSLAGPARLLITLRDVERGPSSVALPLLVQLEGGHVRSVARTTATKLVEDYLRQLTGGCVDELHVVVDRLLSVEVSDEGRPLRVALVDDRFFLAACLAAASGGPGVRPGHRRLARLPFEQLLAESLPGSHRRELYRATSARERRELTAELVWTALFSRWQSLPSAWGASDEPHPMLAAALGRACNAAPWPGDRLGEDDSLPGLTVTRRREASSPE